MDPGRFRECLSLGYSRKRNMANKVGQCEPSQNLFFYLYIVLDSALGID